MMCQPMHINILQPLFHACYTQETRGVESFLNDTIYATHLHSSSPDFEYAFY